MPKNFFQDMVKMKNENRAQLQQKIESHAQEPPKEFVKEPQKESSKESFVETKFASVYDVTKKENGSKGKSKRGIWIVAGISILFLVFALSFLFSSAKITVTPKIKNITLNQNLSAVKDGGTDTLPFDLVAIDSVETKNIKGGQEKDVSIKAEGIVVIYNAFSSTAQKLDINTRLSGSNGKVYKTKTKVTVPGMKNNTPGKVEVGIYGAEAGAVYNSAPLDFKIVGFKGTSRYTKFYGRSKGEITGGFTGKSLVVSDEEKKTAFGDLEATLRTKLLKKATDQIPSGFILFKDAVFLNIASETIDTTPSGSGTVAVNVKGTLYGFLFDEMKLTKKIAETTVPGYDGSEIYIPNIRNLTFSLPAQANLSNFGDVKNIDFNLTGAGTIVWRIDSGKLTNDVLGKSKNDFNQILSQYPNIDSAELSLSPFWKGSLPSKASAIKVIVNYP